MSIYGLFQGTPFFFSKFILGKPFQHLDIGWLILAHGDHLIQEDKLATFEVRFGVSERFVSLHFLGAGSEAQNSWVTHGEAGKPWGMAVFLLDQCHFVEWKALKAKVVKMRDVLQKKDILLARGLSSIWKLGLSLQDMKVVHVFRTYDLIIL
jgi:hypothetical protein